MVNRVSEFETTSLKLDRNLKKIKIFDRDQWTCYWCKQVLRSEINYQNTATIEHILPRSLGGTNQKSNLAAACYRCNNKREVCPAEEFIRLAATFEVNTDKLITKDKALARAEEYQRNQLMVYNSQEKKRLKKEKHIALMHDVQERQRLKKEKHIALMSQREQLKAILAMQYQTRNKRKLPTSQLQDIIIKIGKGNQMLATVWQRVYNYSMHIVITINCITNSFL